MSIWQIILALLSTLQNPIMMKVLTCLLDPKNTTWALKLACITSATQGLVTPGTPDFHTLEAIKHHLQGAVKAGATP